MAIFKTRRRNTTGFERATMTYLWRRPSQVSANGTTMATALLFGVHPKNDTVAITATPSFFGSHPKNDAGTTLATMDATEKYSGTQRATASLFGFHPKKYGVA